MATAGTRNAKLSSENVRPAGTAASNWPATEDVTLFGMTA